MAQKSTTARISFWRHSEIHTNTFSELMLINTPRKIAHEYSSSIPIISPFCLVLQCVHHHLIRCGFCYTHGYPYPPFPMGKPSLHRLNPACLVGTTGEVHRLDLLDPDSVQAFVEEAVFSGATGTGLRSLMASPCSWSYKRGVPKWGYPECYHSCWIGRLHYFSIHFGVPIFM